jgi:hypothetical protein
MSKVLIIGAIIFSIGGYLIGSRGLYLVYAAYQNSKAFENAPSK